MITPHQRELCRKNGLDEAAIDVHGARLAAEGRVISSPQTSAPVPPSQAAAPNTAPSTGLTAADLAEAMRHVTPTEIALCAQHHVNLNAYALRKLRELRERGRIVNSPAPPTAVAVHASSTASPEALHLTDAEIEIAERHGLSTAQVLDILRRWMVLGGDRASFFGR